MIKTLISIEDTLLFKSENTRLQLDQKFVQKLWPKNDFLL